MGRPSLFVAVVLAGAPALPVAETLSGTVTYRERIALPEDAALEVTLEDLSREAPAGVLGKATVEPAGPVPIRFAISYDPGRVDPARSYGVRARITSRGRLLFASSEPHLVLTRGAGREVVLLVRQVPAGPPLGGTRWTLVRLGSGPVEVPAPRRPYLELDLATSRASGFGGCNRFAGPFALDGSRLTFGRDRAATLMACPDGMDLEAAFHAALGEAASYRMHGEWLELLDRPGKVVAVFTAIPAAP
ncbi:MAG TPA: YbaY family lipoprotein [Anaeromyxobacteraceae bacterium]|nr:YbaY family lipoprotein [Anaeromyxobacteraceae bacterium]